MKESTCGGVKKTRRCWTPMEYHELIGKLPTGSPLLPLALIHPRVFSNAHRRDLKHAPGTYHGGRVPHRRWEDQERR